MKTVYPAVVAMAMLVVTGCSKVSSEKGVESQTARSFGFQTFSHSTKATAQTLQSAEANKTVYKMTGYHFLTGTQGEVEAYINNRNFGYGINPSYPNAWNTDSTYFWPNDTYGISKPATMNFFSYGPADAGCVFDKNGYLLVENRNYPTVSVTVPASYAEQKDILAGMVEGLEYTTTVNLAYNHIMSGIRFSAKTSGGEYTAKIKSIKIGVKDENVEAGLLFPSAKYTYAKDNAIGTWAGFSGQQVSYEPGILSDVTITESLISVTKDSGAVILIPQNLITNKVHFAITYDVYKKDGRELVVSDVTKFGPMFATDLDELKPGYWYTYNVTIPYDKWHPIEYSVTINEWTNAVADIEHGSHVDSYNPESLEKGETINL